MTWREAINIVREKQGWRQEDLAEFLGVDPSTVSKMGQGWELHWQCFLKLLPYFIEYDVLQAQELIDVPASQQHAKGMHDDAIRQVVSVSKESAEGSISKGAARGKKHLSPSRIGGHQGRKSGQK